MDTSCIFLRRKSLPNCFSLQTFRIAHLGTHIKTKHLLCAVLSVILLILVANNALADLIAHVGNAQVTEGGSGYIDVFFDIPPGTTDTYALAGYMVEMNITNPTSKIRFTQFAEPQNAIFPNSTPGQTPLRPVLPGSTAAATDELSTGENTIFDKAGLVRVLFTTDSGSAGTYTVSIDPSLARTNFSKGNGDLLNNLTTVSYVSGTITVSPVPEPSMLVLLLIALPLLFLGRFVVVRH
jgi:hypothetical protein